jgi:hypothetical protein
MAKYRQVHTTFWDDGFVLDLTPEEKYFYLYLMTNNKASQCGIYELPKRVIEMQTGYNRETVEKLLARFEEYGKIKYAESTKEILMRNWHKYNWINSPKVIACVEKELQTVKNKDFVEEYQALLNEYGYGIESLSIDLGEEEEEEEEKKKKEKKKKDIAQLENEFDEFWKLYPKKTDKKPAKAKFLAKRKEFDYETIMNGLRSYVLYCRGKDPKYIKYAKTYLHNDSFLETYKEGRATHQHETTQYDNQF